MKFVRQKSRSSSFSFTFQDSNSNVVSCKLSITSLSSIYWTESTGCKALLIDESQTLRL
jgi:hypothetical protein